MKCACCGNEMSVEKELLKTATYKCEECGLSNTQLKENNCS